MNERCLETMKDGEENDTKNKVQHIIQIIKQNALKATSFNDETKKFIEDCASIWSN